GQEAAAFPARALNRDADTVARRKPGNLNLYRLSRRQPHALRPYLRVRQADGNSGARLQGARRDILHRRLKSDRLTLNAHDSRGNTHEDFTAGKFLSVERCQMVRPD